MVWLQFFLGPNYHSSAILRIERTDQGKFVVIESTCLRKHDEDICQLGGYSICQNLKFANVVRLNIFSFRFSFAKNDLEWGFLESRITRNQNNKISFTGSD